MINNNHTQEYGPAFEAVWTDLRNIYSQRLKESPWYASKLVEADLKKWANQIEDSEEGLIEKIAIRVAYEFHTHKQDFTFCDAVINDIFGTDIGRECSPNYFWQIYLAFDAGEAYLEGKKDEDPAEVFTRPRIAEIIKSIEKVSGT